MERGMTIYYYIFYLFVYHNIGKAVAGGVIGGAATWGVNRVLDNRFPARR